MKRTTLTLMVLGLVLIPLGGCELTPDQRVTALQGAVQKTQDISLQLNDKIVLLEGALTKAQAMLGDPNQSNATLVKLRDDIALLQSKLAAAKPVKELIDANLTAYQQQLAAALAGGPLDTQKEFAAYGQGVTTATAALPAPFNLIGLLIGSVVLPLVGGIVGAIAKGKKDRKAIAGIVASVSTLLADTAVVPNADAAKNVLAREQVKVPEAAAAVRVALVAEKLAA
jgi:hypothetical protein